MIGYSLSLCIVDILRDKVSLDDVTVISTGTKACDDEDWNLVLDSYSRTYWRKDPLRAREIANTLRDTGRITQPRCLGLQPVSTGDGIWSFE